MKKIAPNLFSSLAAIALISCKSFQADPCNCNNRGLFYQEETSYLTTAYSDNRIYKEPFKTAAVQFEIPRNQRIFTASKAAWTTTDSRGIWVPVNWIESLNSEEGSYQEHKGWIQTYGMRTERELADRFARFVKILHPLGVEFDSKKLEGSGDDGCQWEEPYYLQFAGDYLSFNIGAAYQGQQVFFAELIGSDEKTEGRVLVYTESPNGNSRSKDPTTIQFELKKNGFNLKVLAGPKIIGLPDFFTPGKGYKRNVKCIDFSKPLK